ncbi:TniQ family protein [Paenibacillus amylolyticus]|uniref:TniQ family protein n=1 Tax=Paenibacillus amylolyticus TaxID=1451 RepID=UPI003241C55C
MATEYSPSLSVKVAPQENEALSSFIIRAARSNGAGIHWFMNNYRSSNSDQIKISDISRLDFYPYNVLNIRLIEQHLHLEKGSLSGLSFQNILAKFKGAGRPENSRFMKGLIRKDLHYCPFCLCEGDYYSLLWRIETINFCFKHHTQLTTICNSCERTINYSTICQIGCCPYCENILAGQLRIPEDIDLIALSEESRKRDILKELLSNKSINLDSKDIAIRILYVSTKKELLSGFYERIGIRKSYLLQFARNSMSYKRSIHLNTIIRFLCETNLSFEEFIRIDVPLMFKERILNGDKSRNSTKYFCQAPWCDFYLQTVSLLFTGTNIKIKGDRRLKWYMYCSKCGCEYAINEGALVERSYFIKGYLQIKDKDISSLSLIDITTITGLTKSQNRRLLAYLTGRGLLCNSGYEYDDRLVDNFVNALKAGERISNIINWACWKNEEHYFLYRYHALVMQALIMKKNKQPDRKNKKGIKHELAAICKQCIKNDVKITNHEISKALGITVQTLRKWGHHEYIQRMKSKQKELQRHKKIKSWMKRIEVFFLEEWDVDMNVTMIYEHLNLSQSYLCDFAPEVNTFIREKRIELSRNGKTYMY